MFSRKLGRSIAAGVAAVAVAGGAYGIVSATASNDSTPTVTATIAQPRSNARSGPAAGGAAGTVAGVSTSSFTLSTAAGQQVTVDETSSTKYGTGASIATGKAVLVLGTANGTTITATQVIVQPTRTSSAAKVIPFERGAPTTSKQVGQIPASYTQGSGTIVGGTTANKATEAALAVYRGGIVDRVVKLSSGEYEVHTIGVNWPHHVFVNKQFKVIGAN